MNDIALKLYRYQPKTNCLLKKSTTLKRLIKNIQPDEEIIVIDAGSVDGTDTFC